MEYWGGGREQGWRPPGVLATSVRTEVSSEPESAEDLAGVAWPGQRPPAGGDERVLEDPGHHH